MSDEQAQYWAQMQAEAAAHEAEQAAADAAQYEAAMEAEQAKPTMPPFRAWVAWHPTQCDKAPRIFDATKSGAWFTLLAIQGYLKGFDTDEEKEHAMRTAIEDGWRIVEVEVREVEE